MEDSEPSPSTGDRVCRHECCISGKSGIRKKFGPKSSSALRCIELGSKMKTQVSPEEKLFPCRHNKCLGRYTLAQNQNQHEYQEVHDLTKCGTSCPLDETELEGSIDRDFTSQMLRNMANKISSGGWMFESAKSFPKDPKDYVYIQLPTDPKSADEPQMITFSTLEKRFLHWWNALSSKSFPLWMSMIFSPSDGVH